MMSMRIYLHKQDAGEYSGIPDSLVRQEATIQNKILETEYHLSLAVDNRLSSSYIEELRNTLAELYLSKDRITKLFENDFANYYNLKYDLGDLKISQLKKKLGNHQAFLGYQVMDSFLYLFVVTGKSFEIIKQDLSGDFFDQITTLRNCISENPVNKNASGEFSAFITSSHALYDVLIRPVKDLISGKDLIIAPHNELTILPFEVLLENIPDKGTIDYSTLQYLFRDHVIHYVYSANLMPAKRKLALIPGKTAIFLPRYPGSLNGSDTLSILRGAQNEALAIQQITKGRLFGFQAANEASFKQEAPLFGVLHLASHAVLDNQNPSNSCLVMTPSADSAEDGYLHAYELLQMSLKARLVVLNGCNTGFGKFQRGEGLMSLARCFFYAGARTISFTLWPVADQSGAILTTLFYKNLQKTTKPAKALNEARKEFLEQADPVTSHPFFWAGYVIMGDNPTFIHPVSAIPVLVLFLIIIVIAIRVLHKRKVTT